MNANKVPQLAYNSLQETIYTHQCHYSRLSIARKPSTNTYVISNSNIIIL